MPRRLGSWSEEILCVEMPEGLLEGWLAQDAIGNGISEVYGAPESMAGLRYGEGCYESDSATGEFGGENGA